MRDGDRSWSHVCQVYVHLVSISRLLMREHSGFSNVAPTNLVKVASIEASVDACPCLVGMLSTMRLIIIGISKLNVVVHFSVFPPLCRGSKMLPLPWA